MRQLTSASKEFLRLWYHLTSALFWPSIFCSPKLENEKSNVYLDISSSTKRSKTYSNCIPLMWDPVQSIRSMCSWRQLIMMLFDFCISQYFVQNCSAKNRRMVCRIWRTRWTCAGRNTYSRNRTKFYSCKFSRHYTIPPALSSHGRAAKERLLKHLFKRLEQRCRKSIALKVDSQIFCHW